LVNTRAYLGSLPASVVLTSSALRGAEYDRTTKTLTLEFRTGRRYKYLGVPETVYTGLATAASHGRYFNQWIKGKYDSVAT
jgi:hypothetical protein